MKGTSKPIDDCPICLCDLRNEDPDKLVWCKTCGINLDESCFEQWATTCLTNFDKVSCVYCRSECPIPARLTQLVRHNAYVDFIVSNANRIASEYNMRLESQAGRDEEHDDEYWGDSDYGYEDDESEDESEDEDELEFLLEETGAMRQNFA